MNDNPAATLCPPGFCGSPLDRADHLRRDDQAMAAARMHPAARWLVLDALKPLVWDDSGRVDLFWARRSEIPDGESVFLGLDADGLPRFAIAGSGADLPAHAVDARALASQLGDGRAAIVATARSVLDWHARHGWCAACGAPTTSVKAGWGRACARCRAEHFPRVDPVVIMLAVKDELTLVGRQPRFPAGVFSALAGFVEPGESLEEATARELFEEAGVTATAVRYVASQPWPFPSSLMIATIADVTSHELALDATEIEEARWVDRGEVAAALAGAGDWQAPPPLAIAHTLLRRWVDRAI